MRMADGLAGIVVGGAVIWPVLVPLVAAAFTLLLRRHQLAQRTVMEVATVLTLLASLLLLQRVARGEVVVMTFGGWPRPFGVSFMADRLGAALSVVTGVIGLASAIYARADIRAQRRRAGFDPFFLGVLASVNGGFLTGDIFNLYVWFELMLVAAMGLVSLDRRPTQVDGVIRYGVMSMLGATCILLGIGLLYGEVGVLDMNTLSTLLANRPPSVALSASAYLMITGFALKAGLFPLFFWLPASYPTAPITASAVLAGLLTKVGFYAALRTSVMVFHMTGNSPTVPGLPALLTVLAVGTMLIAILAALAQTDLRRMMAYHIACQVAYMVLGLALATQLGVGAAIFYMIHSMLVQAGLFLGTGAMARAGGSFDMGRLGGLARRHPATAGAFAALALSISGVPPLSGFWAKFLIIDAALRANAPWLAGVAIVVGFLTLHSMATLWTQAFWRPPPPSRTQLRSVPPAMIAAVALLAMCTLGIGLVVGPVSGFARAAGAQLMPDVVGVATSVGVPR